MQAVMCKSQMRIYTILRVFPHAVIHWILLIFIPAWGITFTPHSYHMYTMWVTHGYHMHITWISHANHFGLHIRRRIIRCVISIVYPCLLLLQWVYSLGDIISNNKQPKGGWLDISVYWKCFAHLSLRTLVSYSQTHCKATFEGSKPPEFSQNGSKGHQRENTKSKRELAKKWNEGIHNRETAK